MKLIGMIIGMCSLAMLLQIGINGFANLIDEQAFWHQWTDRIERAMGLGLILGIGVWIRRTFPLKEQRDSR